LTERTSTTARQGKKAKAASDLLLNPELSRLAFDERIIAFAEDPAVPLLERVRFLGMAGDRLDDFFMTRVAHFKRVLADGENERTIDGLSAAEQLSAIATRTRRVANRAQALLETLLRELETKGIQVVPWASLTAGEREALKHSHGERITEQVRPFVAEPGIPHIRNLRPAIAVQGREAGSESERLLFIELPSELPRFVPVGPGRFVLLEDAIAALLPVLYPGLLAAEPYLFRVTRSAAMELDDEPEDILRAIEVSVARRPFQEVVRLEHARGMPASLRARLLTAFQAEWHGRGGLCEEDVFETGPLLDLSSLAEIADLDRPELKFQPFEGRKRVRAEHGMLAHARRRDLLLHFPHDDFESSVERFLLEAAEDPDVVRVAVTLYRTSKDSSVVDALRAARANGKEVIAAVELKASFDEQDNIGWARNLERQGIRVILSPVQIKVHAKIGLIVRRENGELQRVAYVGTGNLNASTARSYVDFGLLTADPELTSEIALVFALMTGEATAPAFRRLLVSPLGMRDRFLELVEREIVHAQTGRPSGIRLHVNGLGDRQAIAALYRASQAGVRIDIMVRDLCSLRPGLAGVSENIRIVSVVGRLLHHARNFHFRNGGDDEYFIGSADWRPRNFNERVEVVAQIRQPDHQAELDAFLTETLTAEHAWHLRADGSYVRGADVIGGQGFTAAGRK
jgi:polyphosphate kinase